MKLSNLISLILVISSAPLTLHTSILKNSLQCYTSCLANLISQNQPRYIFAQKIADLKLHTNKEEIFELLELALKHSHLEIAHGLARQLITQQGWKASELHALKLSNDHVKNLIKKQYFLLTGDQEVMKSEDGSRLTLSFREVFCSKAIVILNGKADFSHLFLNDVEGIEVYAHPKLDELDLSHNYLQKIPEGIGVFSNLKVLLLNNNKLTSLPANIGNLSHLIRLDLQYNSLEVLPHALNKLTSLWRLNLDANQFAHLPECLIRLPSLKRLSLQKNPLVDLQKRLPELSHIPTLLYEYREKR